MTIKLPDVLPGHWDSRGGLQQAIHYAGMTREQLCGGDLTDMNVSFKTAMIGRHDFDFEGSLSVAKDRIRWLSVQLAITNMQKAEIRKALVLALGGMAGTFVGTREEFEATVFVKHIHAAIENCKPQQGTP